MLDGRLSSIVEVEKGRGVVLRATDHKLPQQKPLEAVRTEIVAAWKKQRGAELAAAAAAEAVKRLTAGESWDSVAKALGVAAQPPKFVGAGGAGRADGDPPRRIRCAQARRASRFTRAFALANGDTAVVALSAVREDPSGDPKEREAQMRREFARSAAAGEAQSLCGGGARGRQGIAQSAGHRVGWPPK